MGREELSETVKVRIASTWKRSLQHQAARENLDLSDIVRRAISDFLDKHSLPSQSELELTADPVEAAAK